MATKKTIRAVLLCALFATVCAPAQSTVIYVDDDAPAGGDGSSWATAYTFLQDALTEAEAAAEPVEIRIAQGTYRPDRDGANPNGTGDRKAFFELLSSLTLAGGYAGVGATEPNARDWEAYATILSGDLAGNDVLSEDPLDFIVDPNDGNWDRPKVWNILIESTRRENSVHILVADGTDQTAVLEGFTVTGGNAYHPPYRLGDVPHFDDNDRAGGILNKGSRLTLISCAFVANSAVGGGSALYSKGPWPIEIVHCRFLDNFNWRGGGGAINTYSVSAIMKNCVFERNDSWMSFGAALYTALCHHEIVDCLFSQNGHVGGDGVSAVHVWQGDGFFNHCEFADNALGAVAVTNHSNMLLQSCKFTGNSGDEGGGINCSAISKMKLDKCMFILNNGARGGGVFISSTELRMTNCLFYANEAKLRGGGALFHGNSTIDVRNSLFWNNQAPSGPEVALVHYEGPIPSTGTIAYSLIQGGMADISKDPGYVFVTEPPAQNRIGVITWGPGNIDADPLFADPNKGEFHLKSQAGRWNQTDSNWVVDDVTSPCIDAGDPASAIGYEPFPNGGRINIGPYGGTAEASKSYYGGPPCRAIIAGDINGDCRVDFKDLVILLNHWLQTGQRAEE